MASALEHDNSRTEQLLLDWVELTRSFPSAKCLSAAKFGSITMPWVWGDRKPL